VPGPLEGTNVVELAAIGPVPFAGMVLADLGADVIRIERPDPGPLASTFSQDPTTRSRRSISINLKHQAGVDVFLNLATKADILLEGLRPGVAERLGIGPDTCFARNPALVYGRMTGWGQTGPLARTAGHDINYLSISGTLSAIGTADLPMAPLNLVADYGGGAMLLLVGVLGAFTHASRCGQGQVVDAAMVDGSALLATIVRGALAAGTWHEKRQANLLDGGAPFYRTYRTSDGEFVAVGALEPQFFSALVAGLGLDPEQMPGQHQRRQWPAMQETLAEVFGSRPRKHWEEVFEGTDACVSPVLSLGESPSHPHIRARETFLEVAGVIQPAPAPRFSVTVPDRPRPPVPAGTHTNEVLEELGYSEDDIGMLRRTGAVSGTFMED